MKPVRSPRFQSDADRRNIAAISCGGLPSGIFGAEQAITSDTESTHHVPRTIFLLNVAAGASRRDAPAGVIASWVSGGVSSWPSAWKRDATLPSGRMVSAQDSAPTGTSAP